MSFLHFLFLVIILQFQFPVKSTTTDGEKFMCEFFRFGIFIFNIHMQNAGMFLIDVRSMNSCRIGFCRNDK